MLCFASEVAAWQYSFNVYSDDDCVHQDTYVAKDASDCLDHCNKTAGCNAVNYNTWIGSCVTRACVSASLCKPSDALGNWLSLCMNGDSDVSPPAFFNSSAHVPKLQSDMSLATWNSYVAKTYQDVDCVNIGNAKEKFAQAASKRCESTPGCNAMNFDWWTGCAVFRACTPDKLGHPTGSLTGYYLAWSEAASQRLTMV